MSCGEINAHMHHKIISCHCVVATIIAKINPLIVMLLLQDWMSWHRCTKNLEMYKSNAVSWSYSEIYAGGKIDIIYVTHLYVDVCIYIT